MKNLSRLLLIVISVVLFSCIKPVQIIVPDSLQAVPAMPVVGTEDSWKLDFGGFHAYNIADSDSRILLTDAKNTSYDIRSFEFLMNTTGNTQYQCYCEFPMKSLDDETFRCVFQNVYNQFDTVELTDKVITSLSGDILIEEYYEYVGKKPNSKNNLIGYVFSDSENQVGMVDVSNVNSETVWINPVIDLQKQIIIAASATSLILKHRKWYEAFYQKADEAIDHQY